MTLPAYPFPARNMNFTDEQIFYVKTKNVNKIEQYYNRIISPEAVTIANQYFSIEKFLMEAFQYVLPIAKNADTCSVRFATIIREAANLFEILTRKIYSQVFVVNGNVKLNIFNFLSLDAVINFSNEDLLSPVLETYLGNGKMIDPFHELKSWNRNEALNSNHIPTWWTAYNKIKHDTNSIPDYATLHSSILSVSAIFILIKKIYGDGLISGMLTKISGAAKEKMYGIQLKQSELFAGDSFELVDLPV